VLSGLATTGSCVLCRGPAGHAVPVCQGCDASLRRSATAVERSLLFAGVDSCAAACEYTGAGRDLVRSLKFGRRLVLAEVAADLIAGSGALRIRDGGQELPVVVPVPADPWRRLVRGFDSADLIAAALGRRLGLPVARLLRRRHSRRQVGRGRTDRIADPPRVTIRPQRGRWRDLAGFGPVPDGGSVPGACVLVDDVITTGATIGACAHALRLAGVERVDAVAFAARPEPGAGRDHHFRTNSVRSL